MMAGALAQLGQRRAQLRRRPPARNVLPAGAVPLQHLERQEELPVRGMDRERLEEAGDRVGDPGVMAQRADIRLAAAKENLRRQAMRPDDAPSA